MHYWHSHRFQWKNLEVRIHKADNPLSKDANTHTHHLNKRTLAIRLASLMSVAVSSVTGGFKGDVVQLKW